MKRAAGRASSLFLSSRLGHFLLTASPWLAAIVVAGGTFNYLPSDWNHWPVAHYFIATLGGLTVLFALFWLRARQIWGQASEVRNQSPPLDDVRREIQRAYRPGAGDTRSGWSHYLGEYPYEQTASPLSTAYGLEIVILLAFQTPRVAISPCQKSIFDYANADGGWSVQSQRGISRPEVTAVVAGVMARLSGPDSQIEKAAATIAEAMRENADPLMNSSTYVVATVLEHAPFLGLPEENTLSLISRLVEGAVKTVDGFHWTESLVRHNEAVASTALTAQVAIAFQSIERDAELSSRAQDALNGAISWLEKNADMTHSSSEVIRYSAEGEQDLNSPKHFTAALVLIALLQSGRGSGKKTFEALQAVWGRFGKGGVWAWEDGESPIWMTYFGLRALIAWSVRSKAVD